MITVRVPAEVNRVLPLVGKGVHSIQVKADEIHISTHGVLVLKRYGNIVRVFAHGEWLSACKGDTV